MKKNTNYIVAILGTQNPIGKTLLAELESQCFPAQQLCLLDLHQEAGARISYCNQTLLSEPLDLFNLMQPHILFLCEPRIFDCYPHHFIHHKNWIIDCTGRMDKAACIIPNLNGHNIHCLRHKLLCAPNSASIALAQVCVPLDQRYHLLNVQAVGVLGSWYAQPSLSDVLIQQTRHCFTQTSTIQPNVPQFLAFNLIPDFFKGLSHLVPHQMKCFTKAPVQFFNCFAPVIRGGLFHLTLQFEKRPTLAALQKIYGGNASCQLLPPSKKIGTHDLLSEDKLYLQYLSLNEKTLSLWLMQDSLQTGFIQNAVQILSLF